MAITFWMVKISKYVDNLAISALLKPLLLKAILLTFVGIQAAPRGYPKHFNRADISYLCRWFVSLWNSCKGPMVVSGYVFNFLNRYEETPVWSLLSVVTIFTMINYLLATIFYTPLSHHRKDILCKIAILPSHDNFGITLCWPTPHACYNAVRESRADHL